MRHISVFIIILTFVLRGAYGQHTKEERKKLEFLIAQDSLPRNIFLDSTLLTNMKVNVSNTRQIWWDASFTENHINLLLDTRLKFANRDSAVKFHKKFLRAKSGYGPEIKSHKIKYVGADEFRVFNGGRVDNKRDKPYGLKSYWYVFVVNNYFVKIVLSCNKDYKPEKFQNLVTEVIKRIKN